MTPTRTKNAPEVHAVRAMFAGLGLSVCDDDEAIGQARDAQRDSRNRQLNSTKGSVAVAAQAWFEAVDALLNRRAELLEVLYADFSALADAVLVVAGASGKRRLRGRVRAELTGLAQRWMGAREDLAAAWVERWLVERGAEKWAGTAAEAKARRTTTPGRARSRAGTPRAKDAGEAGTRKRLLMAVGSALALVVAIAGLYHSVGLGTDIEFATASALEASPTSGSDTVGDDGVQTDTDPFGGGEDLAREPLDERADEHEALTEARLELVTGVESPEICFGGHRLQLVVNTADRVQEQVLPGKLLGITLGSVRRTSDGLLVELQVNRLLPEVSEGQASWAFRLLDLDGRPSGVVSGSCRVLPGGW